MQSKEDRRYFLRREKQEREAAEQAGADAKPIHVELADRYAALVRRAESRAKSSTDS